VNSVAWSPSSHFSVISCQDSTLTLVKSSDQTKNTLLLDSAPITNIIFLSDNSFVGIGFDRHFYLFNFENDKW
jgi:hypothetical protein